MTQAREAAAQTISPMRGWGSACAIFFAVVLLALAATLGAAWLWAGPKFLTSAFVAWGLCWFAALIGLFMVFLGRMLGQGIGAVLLAMGVRMGLPLAAALLLVDQSPFWGETKLVEFLLGNYLLALIAETALAVHLLAGTSLLPVGKPGAGISPSPKA